MGRLRWMAGASLAMLGMLAMGGCATVDERTLTLSAPPAGTPVAIDVRNDYGSIEVRVDPTLPRIEVTERLRTKAFASKSERQGLAEAVRTVSEQEIDERGRAVVRVRVERDARVRRGQRVDLVVRMPRCGGALARVDRGDVVLVGVGGAVQVESGAGSIEVRMDRPMESPVALTTGRGNIFLQVPPGSTGIMDLATERGTARFFSRVSSLVDADAGRTTLRGLLGEGINPVTLRTGRGDAAVMVLEDPIGTTRMGFVRNFPMSVTDAFRK